MKELFEYLKPEHLRYVLVVLSVALIGRAVWYLLTGEPFAYFSSSYQQGMIYHSLKFSVPMVVMTVMWPVVLAALNQIQEKTRLKTLSQ